MFESMIIGVGGVVGLMLLWYMVQSWWGRTFSDNITDEDVLAGRSSCGNCGCATFCEKNGNKISTEEYVNN